MNHTLSYDMILYKSHYQFVLFVTICNHNLHIMKSENLMKFGKRLRELRKQKKLTQEELAEKIGFSPNFVGMIERGERNTTVENLFSIANVLEVSLSDFFNI